MITVIVKFQFEAEATIESATAIFRSTAARYLGMSALIRKYYIFNPETRKGGGCYLFTDRAKAEQVFDDKWKAFVTEKYGSSPEVVFFETPVVVDNLSNEIIGIE